jgi:hypothetical protein
MASMFRAGAAMIALSAASLSAYADDGVPAAPSLTSILESSGITASGYVAASYYQSSGDSTYHEFDIHHDSFQLDQAALTIAYQPKSGFGAVVNMAAGEDMRVLHAAEDGNDNTFDIVQGFIQYATGSLTVIAGKYVTLAGAEVIAPTGNSNFSRSLLFYAEPMTHTGVRATLAVGNAVSLIAGVNNGWNTTSTSYGPKTVELGAAFTPGKQFSLTAQAYVGKDPGFDAQKMLFDVVATINATDALSFVVSYDRGRQEQAQGLPNLDWNGIAAYANFALTDRWRLSLRVESLDDEDGFASGTKQRLKEATLTLGFAPLSNFDLRLEGRYDKSDQDTFVGSPDTGKAMEDHQTGFAVQGIFKF